MSSSGEMYIEEVIQGVENFTFYNLNGLKKIAYNIGQGAALGYSCQYAFNSANQNICRQLINESYYRQNNDLNDARRFLAGINKLVNNVPAIWDKLPEDKKKEVTKKIITHSVSIITETTIKIIVCSAIAGYIIKKIGLFKKRSKLTKFFAKNIISLPIALALNTISLIGVIDFAKTESIKIKKKNYEFWQFLYENDLDMVYFIFEDSLNDYINELSNMPPK